MPEHGVPVAVERALCCARAAFEASLAGSLAAKGSPSRAAPMVSRAAARGRRSAGRCPPPVQVSAAAGRAGASLGDLVLLRFGAVRLLGARLGGGRRLEQLLRGSNRSTCALLLAGFFIQAVLS